LKPAFVFLSEGNVPEQKQEDPAIQAENSELIVFHTNNLKSD
jgi:hypothetical protein